MSAVSILPEEAHWQSRTVRYYAGEWDAIRSVMPEFDLVPFAAGQVYCPPFSKPRLREWRG
jgi:hypothetical protein